jgi:hypothetical protein
MPKSRGQSLLQLTGEAERYAAFYFDPAEQAQMMLDHDRPVDADYAVLVVNRFVPIDWVPGIEPALRTFTRRGGNGLSPEEDGTLKDYWRELEQSTKALAKMFLAGEPTAHVAAKTRADQTWPAVGVAASEEEMRALLMTQFETLRHADVLWQCVDSSSYPTPKPDGLYVLIDWFWHGF